MLKKIKRAFGFGSCDPMEGSTIIINAEKLERRVALLENGVLENTPSSAKAKTTS